MSGRRNSAYYRDRLKRDFPSIHARLLSGRFKSVRQAAVAAGLRKETTPLQDLKRAWTKASDTERLDFLIGNRPEFRVLLKATARKSLLTADRQLRADVIKRIRTILGVRNIRIGEAMVEMGFNPRDASLGQALTNSRVRPALELALENWLKRYG